MGTWSASTAPSSTSSTDWHSAVATTAASLSCRVTWRCFSAGTTTGALTRATGSAARLPPRSSPTLRIGVTQHDEEFFGGAPSVNTSRWLDNLDEHVQQGARLRFEVTVQAVIRPDPLLYDLDQAGLAQLRHVVGDSGLAQV